ncbi:HPP family protein [Aureimonas pseudogalii]|uniref:HPP family protein n=1 Tax=Aureimonas pseudogalii TaxID=1744844 RepID=UPI00160610AB|nr:HPP family protein [Aureimonas pseudogalii]
MLSRLSAMLPEAASVSVRERLRAACGALVGILGTGVVSQLAVADGSALPVLIAPMGASAVLLFAVPASPLAQPWSILGGNLVAALVGVSAALLVANPLLAASLAIAVAIPAMMTLRCLHPPSGAVALTAVLGGAAIRDLGYGFVVWPVLANSLLLLAVALAFNNATGRRYPHRASSASARPAPSRAPAATVGVSDDDLDAVLRDEDQVFDIARSDLKRILRKAQFHWYARQSGGLCAGDVMIRDVVAVAPDASLREAFELLRAHGIKALPVTDDGARVLGIVTQTDLLDKAAWGRGGPRLASRHRVRLTLSRGRAPYGAVEDIMTSPVETVSPETSVAAVALFMSEGGLHHLPVVADDGKLVGIVAQSDIVAALLQSAAGRPQDAAP